MDRNLKRKSVLLWRCCSVSCSLEKQICSQSFSDKHTAAWWIYWSLLEYKLTEKNDKFQFFFFTRQCKWKIVRHKGLLTTASHVKKVLKWLESFFLSLSLFWTPIHFFTPDMMFLLGECVEKINCVNHLLCLCGLQINVDIRTHFVLGFFCSKSTSVHFWNTSFGGRPSFIIIWCVWSVQPVMDAKHKGSKGTESLWTEGVNPPCASRTFHCLCSKLSLFSKWERWKEAWAAYQR